MSGSPGGRLSKAIWRWLGNSGNTPIAIVLVIFLIVSTGWHVYVNRRWDLHRDVLSEAIVHTQRLAWATMLAPTDDSAALSALLDSKQRLGRLVSVLLNGGRLDNKSIPPLPVQFQTEFAESARWWFRIERAATALQAMPADNPSGASLASVSDYFERFVNRYENWAEPNRTDLPSIAFETAILVERLSHSLNSQAMSPTLRLRIGDATQIPSNLSRIQANIESMINGDPARQLAPAKGKTRDRLIDFRSDLAVLVKYSSSMGEQLPRMAESLDSARVISMETDQLRVRLTNLSHQLTDQEAPLRWLLISSELLLLVVIGIARAQFLIAQAKDKSNAIEQQAIDIIQAQTEAEATLEAKREGATAALKGVLAVLQQTAENTHKATEHASNSVHIQAQQLMNAGQSVLQLAHAFHNMSQQTTAVAKTTLTSRQEAQDGQTKAMDAARQWELLRQDIQGTAAGLRRAGEASRALGAALADLPQEHSVLLQPLLLQARDALREAVASLASSTLRMSQGETYNRSLIVLMSQHQSAWVYMLDKVEQCAGSAAAQAESALALAKSLNRSSKTAIASMEQNDRLPAQLK